jgi:colanic acid biosynthesis glycosyl transferase WcaI
LKILILGINYAPEKVGIAVYSAGMAEALAERGHQVQVIAAQPYYPAWKIMEGFNAFTYRRGAEGGVDVTRVPHYIPSKPSGAKRLLHHASFAAAALFPMLGRAIAWRPDIVLTVAPSLVAAPLASLAAALCGARSWLHIQDFEVEAAFATGLLKDGGKGARLARWFESKVLGGFDVVSTISPQMCRKLAEKGIEDHRIVEFRNWADVDTIQPMTSPSPYRAEWGITTPHVALYSGNIANKQGIEIVVAAAGMLAHRQDLTFVVCGEGPNRANLEQQAAGLSNIQFHDLQPKERLNDLMGLATIHLLPQLAGAADLVLPSKLTNMLASGRPVVATAAPGTGLAQEVDGCGLVTPPGDAAAFAQGIERLAEDAAAHAEMGQAARQRALSRWSQSATLEAFHRRLTALVSGSPAEQQVG